jgi:hypothetical protein
LFISSFLLCHISRNKINCTLSVEL